MLMLYTALFLIKRFYLPFGSLIEEHPYVDIYGIYYIYIYIQVDPSIYQDPL